MQVTNQTPALTNLSNLISSYGLTDKPTLVRIQRNISQYDSLLLSLNQETDKYMIDHLTNSLSYIIRDIFTDIAYSFDKKEINLSQYIEMLTVLNQ